MTSMSPPDAYRAHQAWLTDYRARHAASLERYRASLDEMRTRQQLRLLMAERARAPVTEDGMLTFATTVPLGHPSPVTA